MTVLLDIKNIAFDDSSDDLDWSWLNKPYAERLRLHFLAMERGLNLEQAVKGVTIGRFVDKSMRYDIKRDAF
jgi:hypothetical protein